MAVLRDRLESFGRVKMPKVNLGMLANPKGGVPAGRGREQGEAVGLPQWFRVKVGVAGLTARARRGDPDLEQVDGLGRGGIELGVLHAGPCGHVLELASLDDATISHRVLMLQLTSDDVGEDLHRGVWVSAEAFAGSDDVVIDDP